MSKNLIRIYIFIQIIFLSEQAPVEQYLSLRERHPDFLLNEDYGILQESDVVMGEVKSVKIPYDIASDRVGGYRWQCFPTKNIKFKVNSWKGHDGMGRSDVVVDLCDAEIWAKTSNLSHGYFGTRAWPIDYCKRFSQSWKKLVENEKYICLNGWPNFLKKTKISNETRWVKSWTWNSIKTFKGCYSHFEGDCDSSVYEASNNLNGLKSPIRF